MDLSNVSIEIFLIRHGKPVIKANHWIKASTPLSQEGLGQAEKIALKLRKIQFDALITSPLTRAKQTAEVMEQRSQEIVDLQEEEWLSEIDLGDWAGSNKTTIIKSYPFLDNQVITGGYNSSGPLIARLLKSNKDFCFPSGECLISCWKRVSDGLLKTLDQFRGQKNKRVALIGHGGSFTIIMLTLLGYSFNDTQFPIFIFGMGDSTIIRIRKEQIFLLNMNSFYLLHD
jgi:broad specificity phosphatase PhoE